MENRIASVVTEMKRFITYQANAANWRKWNSRVGTTVSER